MSYPKPLSQKTLDKMYKESNLSEEKIVFLRKLFDSASALYGIIPLCDLWEVYKEYSQKAEAVKIHRKDILSTMKSLIFYRSMFSISWMKWYQISHIMFLKTFWSIKVMW